jgi:ABC-type nickel/cobalt efflux system permease component RcnA
MAAVALGAAHALEVDHMVAVSAFVGQQPRVGAATMFGVRWGIGHALVVLIVGGLLAWSNIGIPRGVDEWMELAVGLMLVALGAWVIHSARRLHFHKPSRHGGHAHLHAHSPEHHPHSHAHADPTKRHRHLSTIVGAMHGLAGTAPIVALIPVTLLPGTWSAVGYLVAFGMGTVLAMGIYAALAALAAQRAASSLKAARRVAVFTGVTSVVVGIWWILRAASALNS